MSISTQVNGCSSCSRVPLPIASPQTLGIESRTILSGSRTHLQREEVIQVCMNSKCSNSWRRKTKTGLMNEGTFCLRCTLFKVHNAREAIQIFFLFKQRTEFHAVDVFPPDHHGWLIALHVRLLLPNWLSVVVKFSLKRDRYGDFHSQRVHLGRGGNGVDEYSDLIWKITCLLKRNY